MRRRVLSVLLVAVLAGCSSSAHHVAAAPVLGAAEPATAPPVSTAPAGTSVAVGAAPEGIVYDPVTDTVAVAARGPDRLLLLDATTLAVRRSVPLPGHVRHLQLAAPGGPVLVPCEDANSLLQVDPATGAVTTTKVGDSPHDAARTATGLIVAGDEFGKSLTVISDGAVVRTMGEVKQPGGVVALAGDQVAVIDVAAFTVSTYDAATGQRIAVLPAGAGPTHGVAVDDTIVAVSDTRGNALLLFGTSPLRRLARLPLDGAPYGLAVDRSTHTVWVTLTGRNQVVGVSIDIGDLVASTMRVIATYPTVGQPDTVAVEPGSHRLWITGTKSGVVQLLTR